MLKIYLVDFKENLDKKVENEDLAYEISDYIQRYQNDDVNFAMAEIVSAVSESGYPKIKLLIDGSENGILQFLKQYHHDESSKDLDNYKDFEYEDANFKKDSNDLFTLF